VTPAVRSDAGPKRVAVSPLINFWFWAITCVGAMIVLLDGLTQQFKVAEELAPLTYVPSWWALAFAAATLPLCIGFAMRVKAPLTDGLLLWFLLGTTAYVKDFAYLKAPGAPIFVTDVVLALLLVRLFLWPRRRWISARSWTAKLLYCFLAAGVIAATRGFLSGQPVLFVLRDSAIVVYALFLLVGAYGIRNWDAIRRVMLFFALGAGLSTLHALAWLTAQPGQRRYVGFGVYILAALVGALLLTINRRIPARWGWALVGLFGCGLLLANARTLFVALAVLLGVVFLFGASAQKRAGVARWKLAVGTAVAAALVFVAVLQTDAGAALVERTTEELVSGTLEYADDPNAQYRFLAWAEAFGRFSANPLLGEGFGVPFGFERSDRDVRPHNTFLTVLYKMGLLGLVPLGLLLALFYRHGLRALWRWPDHPGASYLYALLLGHAGMCLFGGLNLLLESPFLASIYWVLLGVGLRLISLLRVENLHRTRRTSVALPARP
jgi:O-antigen ligase